MSVASAFKVAEKVVTVLSGVAAAAAVADVVGQKTGLMKPGEGVLRTVAGGVVDAGLRLSGAPSVKAAPETLAGSPPALPTAPRTVCPMCQSGPVLAGAAGEQISIGVCDEHAAQTEAAAAGVDAMYAAWAESRGIDMGAASKCGPQPKPSSYKGPSGLNLTAYQQSVINWQACKQAEQDAAAQAAANKAAIQAAAKKAKEAGYTQGKKIAQNVASAALAQQAKKYQDQIDAMNAAAAQAKTDEQRAAIQAQLDAANAAKAAADKALADSQAQAKDAQHQADITALQAQVAAAAKQPGGMDQFIQQFMLQQMMQQQPTQAPAFQPTMMMAPDGSGYVAASPQGLPMFAPQPQVYAQPMVAPQMMAFDEGGYGDPFAGGEFAFDFAGAAPETPAPPDLVAALGLPAGTATLGEVRELFDWRQRDGLSNEQLDEMLSAMRSMNIAPCPTGACGIR